MNIKLAIALVQFVIQFLRYMDSAKNNSVGHKIEKLVAFRAALAECEKGKGEKLEEMFTIMRPGGK